MNRYKFTSGKWSASPSQSFYVMSDSDPIMVCNASTQANAQAIAALPDLVNALESIIKECGPMAVTDEPTGAIEKISFQARMALSKLES